MSQDWQERDLSVAPIDGASLTFLRQPVVTLSNSPLRPPAEWVANPCSPSLTHPCQKRFPYAVLAREVRMQFSEMTRRDLIALLGGTGATWSIATQAQEAGRTYRLGFLIPTSRDAAVTIAFFDELRTHGFVEGQNLGVVPGGFNVPIARIPEVAEAVVKAAPDAIVAGPDLQLRAVQALTKTIPIIGMTEDMVASGLVASLSRPGGNTTGISLLSPELDGKRQEILIVAVPGVRRMAALFKCDRQTTPAHAARRSKGARHRTFTCWCCQAGGDCAGDQRGQSIGGRGA